MASRHSISHGHREGASRVVFYHRWCKSCNICVAFCPKGALAMDASDYPELADPNKCNSCGLCEVLCPDFAISVPARHTRKRGLLVQPS